MIKIVLFNNMNTVTGRVTLLLPTIITKRITLLSTYFSVVAIVISFLARILRGISSVHAPITRIIIKKSDNMVDPVRASANQKVTASMFAAKYRSKREV